MAFLKTLLAGSAGLAALLLAWSMPPTRVAQAQPSPVAPKAPPSRTGPVTAAEWPALLAQGKRTGVIDLGDRQVIDLPRTIQSDTPLTIRGGRFGPVELENWRNVILDGGRFEASSGAAEYQYLLAAFDAENLTIRNAHFSGYEMPNGMLMVRGPSIRGGHNVTIEHSTIEHLAGFSNFIRTNGARFADNDLRDMREGLEVQGARNIVIERNRFEKFRPFEGDHADAIQFFTTGLTQPGDTAAQDVTIRDNLMLLDSKAQGVFAGDEINIAGTPKGYARFVIENNIIVGAGWHGITTAFTDGLTVRNNRLGRIAGQDIYDSRINVDGSSVVVEGNEANDFIYHNKLTESRNKKAGERPAADFEKMADEWVKRFRPG
ncbi:hypothetical protein ACFSCW_11415 [Sphingomonas tabacisoli]|uniref:Right handed beta helix domain-containing protein n=1 Tax=Sphingomonas tabacisoli TaxID=2249466 RepID=A0ABW4I5J4_9SPHN